jgi:hypothetical protein
MDLGPQTAVEVEAIPPEQLRVDLEEAVMAMAENVQAWNTTLAAERSEREVFRRLLAGDTSAWSPA